MNAQTQGRRPSGFTLIELMVSMGITSIIITVLVTITGVATDTWTRSRSELRASRQAKVLIDTMAKDFESMIARRGSNVEWLYAAIDNDAQLPTVVQGSNAEVAQFTFFTAATDRYNGQLGTTADLGGDVSCVSYQMRFQDPITGGTGNRDTSTFVMYRKLVNPDQSFTTLIGQEDLDQAFDQIPGDVNAEENFVCENIHQITATFLVEVFRPSSQVPEIARVTLDSSDVTGEFRLRGDGIETSITVPGFTSQDDLEAIRAGRLTGIELSVSALSDAGMIRRNARGGGLNEKDYARQSFHYSRVIDVPTS